MRSWVSKPALAGALCLVALTVPASGQEGPESLLPPGFGGPAVTSDAPPQPIAVPKPLPTPRPVQGAGEATDMKQGQAPALTTAASDSSASGEGGSSASAYKLPPPTSRPIDAVGAIGPRNTGFAYDAFHGASGPYLVTLMQRLDGPLTSRWATITLRRALASQVPTAQGTRPADWIAERALLLLRLGDVHAARMLVQAVPIDRYSSRLYSVAAEVAMASGDIAGLCPIADIGEGLSKDRVWPMARAMCAGLIGDPGLVAELVGRLRQRNQASASDLALIERVAAASAGGQRTANIDWDEVSRLSSVRFGLATAAGETIPLGLFRTVGPQVLAWQAMAPGVALDRRVVAARTAAALGVLSSANLVDLYSAQADETDPFAIASTPAGQLRKAYVDNSTSQRLNALDSLWAGDVRTRDGYAGRIVTARAAAALPVNKKALSRADELIASMLSAGLDTQAARWWPVVADEKSDQAIMSRGLLSVGMPQAPSGIGASLVKDVQGLEKSDRSRHRSALLLAGLAGLGRLDTNAINELNTRLDAELDAKSAYSERLSHAAAAGRSGEVALLAAVGLQAKSWAAVPPAHLFHIVSALKRVGREAEARMIAAEALMRS